MTGDGFEGHAYRAISVSICSRDAFSRSSPPVVPPSQHELPSVERVDT